MDADFRMSPSRSPSWARTAPPVKHTYRRSKPDQNIIAESHDADTSSTTLVASSSSNTTLTRQSSVCSSDGPSPKKGKSILAGIIEKTRSADVGDDSGGETRYDFGWKDKLRAMDEDEEENTRSSSLARSFRDAPRYAGGTSPSGRNARRSPSPRGDSQEFSAASIPPQTQSPSALCSQPSLDAVSFVSMSDASPVPPVSSGNRRAIPSYSDHQLSDRISRSAPSATYERPQFTTLSDSDDENMEKSAKIPNEGKGKAKSSERLVSPLGMEEIDLSSATSSRHAKREARATRKHAGGIKKPTKKEVRESAVEQARLMAGRDGRIASTTRTLAPLAFLDKLRQDTSFTKLKQHSPKKPIPTSDPIQEYSSPIGEKRLLHAESSIMEPLSQEDENFSFGAASGLIARSPVTAPPATQSSPLKSRHATAMALGSAFEMDIPPPVDSDSDGSLCAFGDVLRKEDKKREAQRSKKHLQDFKMIHLEKQRQMKAQAREAASDDDDDLVIIRDGEKPRRCTKSAVLSRKVDSAARCRGASTKRKEGAALTAAQKKKLNADLLRRYEAERQEEVKKKEEDWVRRGGQLKEIARARERWDVRDVVKESIQRLDEKQRRNEENEENGSDEEWRPEERGSGDEDAPTQVYVDNDMADEGAQYSGDDGQENVFVVARDENPMDDGAVETEPDDQNSDSDNEEVPRQRRRTGRLPGDFQESEEEYDEGMPSYVFGSGLAADTSFASVDFSLASTSDEEDQENDPKKVYDEDEDKENKALPRAFFNTSPVAFLLGSQGREPLGFSDDEASGSRPGRPPSGVLNDGDDRGEDPFAFPVAAGNPLGSPIMFGAELDSFSRAASPSMVEFKSRKGGFSQFSDDEESGPVVGNDENAGSEGLKPAPLLAAFSQFFEPTLPKSNPLSEKSLGKRPAREEPIEVWPDEMGDDPDTGGLLAKLRGNPLGEVPLTLEPSFEPALDVDESRKRELDAIFEREQELVVQDAVPRERSEEELYVNDLGFYTQTRPDESPLPLILPSPTQSPLNTWFRMKGDYSLTQSSLADRPALGTLAFEEELDPSQPEPLRRLRKRDSIDERRSPSPEEPQNAFEVMRDDNIRKTKKSNKRKLEKSDFVDGQAEESDEDKMFGFGKRKADDDEEGEDDEDDQPLEGLVDDGEVDVKEDLVMEKVKEQQEEDDKKLQQIHLNATKGKYRNGRRRRDGALGSDDSESEDEDQSRVRPVKRRKIEGDTIYELEKHPETQAFVEAYKEALDEPDFAYLHHMDEDAEMENAGDAESEEEDQDKPEFVSHRELAEELRAAARSATLPEDTFDPHNADWIDRSDDDFDDLRVREVQRRGKTVATRRLHADVDPVYGVRKPIDPEVERRDRMWASGQKTRGAAGTMASIHGATVTSFGQSKKIGKVSRMAARSTAAASSSQPAKSKPAKKPSFLSTTLARKKTGA
ncbi:hypothetical protein OE88DRAFT_716197 [Heliocybe sulcata]|uniref:DNA replication checkpoint mediator MRC1 domain-containing protein n=1 Tax=Heliocybe sulcata TaxID=5364 RepID=A0A5C3NH38_9AGAM|nr:hypothetical protein OE88DRAFT_716197 [Heliocybe sulcata]